MTAQESLGAKHWFSVTRRPLRPTTETVDCSDKSDARANSGPAAFYVNANDVTAQLGE